MVLGAVVVVPGVLPIEVVGVVFGPPNKLDPELPAPEPTLPNKPTLPPPPPAAPKSPPVGALDVSVGGGPAGVVELPMLKVVLVGAGVVEPPEVAPNMLDVGALLPNRPLCTAGVDPAADVPNDKGFWVTAPKLPKAGAALAAVEPNVGGFVVADVDPKSPPDEVLAGAPNKFVDGVPLPFALPPAVAPKLKAMSTLEGVVVIKGMLRRKDGTQDQINC